MRNKVAYLGLICWWILIFALTTLPAKSIPNVSVHDLDKLIHICMYGGLSFWLTTVLGKRGLSGLLLLTVVSIIGLSYGIFDEWHQSFVGRSTDFHDLIANMIGIIIVASPISIYFHIKKVKQRAN